jgi:hypothetical protein
MLDRLSPSRFMADCDDRDMRWQVGKKFPKVSRTRSFCPPCIYTGFCKGRDSGDARKNDGQLLSGPH